MHPPPTNKPKCIECGKLMYQTHSRYDFACTICATEVSYWLDPAGMWGRPKMSNFIKKNYPYWMDK